MMSSSWFSEQYNSAIESQYITDVYAFIMSFKFIQQEQSQQQSFSNMSKSALAFLNETENLKFMSLNSSKFTFNAELLKIVSKISVQNKALVSTTFKSSDSDLSSAISDSNLSAVTFKFSDLNSSAIVQNPISRKQNKDLASAAFKSSDSDLSSAVSNLDRSVVILKFSDLNFSAIVQNSIPRKTKIENTTTTISQAAEEIKVVTEKMIYYAHQTMKKHTRFRDIVQTRENRSTKKSNVRISSSIVLNIKKRFFVEKTKFLVIEISNEENDIDKYVRLKKLIVNFHESMIRISKIRHSNIKLIIKNWNIFMKDMKNLDNQWDERAILNLFWEKKLLWDLDLKFQASFLQERRKKRLGLQTSVHIDTHSCRS